MLNTIPLNIIRFTAFWCGFFLCRVLDDPPSGNIYGPAAVGMAFAIAAPYAFLTLRRMVFHR